MPIRREANDWRPLKAESLGQVRRRHVSGNQAAIFGHQGRGARDADLATKIHLRDNRVGAGAFGNAFSQLQPADGVVGVVEHQAETILR